MPATRIRRPRPLPPPPAWERQYELELLEREIQSIVGDRRLPVAESVRRLKPLQCLLELVEDSPAWRHVRPRRATIQKHHLAAWWQDQGGPFLVDLGRPACFRCGMTCVAWTELQAAHLVDRSAGGLDHEPNLVLLCALCHATMPPFEPGQEDQALAFARGAD